MVFKNTIYDKSFYEMLYSIDNSNQKGFELNISDRINIGKDASVDLEYTVCMDKSAGNNLQGLKAIVDFIVNSQENPYDSGDGDNDRDNSEKKDRLKEKSVNKVPDISGHWAHDCILALIEHDVLEPGPNGSVRPEDYITRAEAAVLMGKALGLREVN